MWFWARVFLEQLLIHQIAVKKKRHVFKIFKVFQLFLKYLYLLTHINIYKSNEQSQVLKKVIIVSKEKFQLSNLYQSL